MSTRKQALCFVIVLIISQQLHCSIQEPLELDFPQPLGQESAPLDGSHSQQKKDEQAINEASEQEVIASIEKGELYLQRAESAPTSVGKCKKQINAAIASLSLVETYVLEDEYESSRTHLGNAKKNVEDCNAALEAAPQQALSHIEEAEEPLQFLTGRQSDEVVFQPETAGSGAAAPGKSCLPVDGTTCQFSNCGKGKLLPTCVVGFASGTTGGAQGQSYIVTNADDNAVTPSKGTLRYGVSLGGDDKGGVWITFAKSMIITLTEMLWIRSSTTIDGRGVNITINGRSIVLAGVKNVILHNFQINTVGETDTVHIFAGTSNVWVDHLTSFNAKLGLVSVVQGSTDVTISNCFLTNPNFNMLLGASDADIQDQKMRVTVYRNWFKDSMQRMPHCRWGYCHVINNLYTNWGYYAIGARARAKVKSEANVFIAARRPEVTPWFQGVGADFDLTPVIQSTGDLLLNGSTFHQFLQFGPAIAPQYRSEAYYPPKRATSTLATLVQNCAGALVWVPEKDSPEEMGKSVCDVSWRFNSR
ncbi:putative pectate lyase 21 [Selaginella moellendorffii]|uniref:putative pectate lyase 21 n=1 Tax=Selaginella moellendorffii TaxID=88036 RepID=UPI000D1CF88B|nr:putative pectate lyase 21 [Selaginella moellendorffii]|eukprot:XP_002969320.2 putative pectate lyase 21 [Selaginella moellendorffii]